jgi:hypothetical protein
MKYFLCAGCSKRFVEEHSSCGRAAATHNATTASKLSKAMVQSCIICGAVVCSSSNAAQICQVCVVVIPVLLGLNLK